MSVTGASHKYVRVVRLLTMRRDGGCEPLELASFDVAEVVEGSAGSWSEGSLTLCLRDLTEAA